MLKPILNYPDNVGELSPTKVAEDALAPVSNDPADGGETVHDGY